MRLLSLILSVVLCVVGVRGADFDPLDATIEQNIAYPPVPAKSSVAVSTAMRREGTALAAKHFNVSYKRNGEVISVVVPASQLFRPNDVNLSAGADATLRALQPMVARANDFKVIIAVHTDDTGDSVYSDSISSERVNAIESYYYERLGEAGSDHIIPYGLGRDEPLAGNNSMNGRAKNRRVEFLFVPTREFIAAVRRR